MFVVIFYFGQCIINLNVEFSKNVLKKYSQLVVDGIFLSKLVCKKSTSNQQMSTNSCKVLFIEFAHALKFNAKLSQGFLEISPK